jgi:hypothetical protein
MDQGSPLQQTLAGQEMIGATAAACGLPPAGPAFAAAPVGEIRQGVSKDGTLAWQVVVQPDRSRTVIARYWDGASWRDAISERVAAP